MEGPTSHTYFSQRLRLHYVDWGNDGAPAMLMVHGGRDCIGIKTGQLGAGCCRTNDPPVAVRMNSGMESGRLSVTGRYFVSGDNGQHCVFPSRTDVSS